MDRRRSEQQAQQVGAGDAIDHAVMRLADNREAAAGEPVDDPHLPERTAVVERLRQDATGHTVQRALVARPLEVHVADVRGQVEVGIVDPRWRAVDRRWMDPLAVARDGTQLRTDVLADPPWIDAAGVGE